MPKILVVDDDLVVLATLSMGLRQVGHQVMQADNGEDALRIAREEGPDMAILDVRMPGMNGIEVAHALRQSGGTTPFVFLSAFNDNQIVQSAVSAGALGYLVKPVEISRIVPAIEIALARADEMTKLAENNANLIEALNNNREIDIAIGMLMGQRHINRSQAFEMLRAHSRNHRTKVLHIAQQLIAGNAVL